MKIPDWCAPFIGLPYEPGGRGPDAYDCWGLALKVWREHFGLQLADYDGIFWGPGRNAADVAAVVARETQAFWRPVESELPGDGILIRAAGQPLHVAVVVAPGLMLHAHDGADSCAEAYRTSIKWQNRISAFYRPATLP